MNIPQPVLISGLGGVAVQLLYIADGLNAPKDRQQDFKSLVYYLGILINIGLSIILGYVYFDEEQKLNKIVYFHGWTFSPVNIAYACYDFTRSS